MNNQPTTPADIDIRTLAAVTDLSVPAWRRRLARAGLKPVRTGPDGRHYYRWADLAPLTGEYAPASPTTTPATGDTLLYRRLGEAVEQQRRAKGLTRTQLAARIGVTRATVARIEQGAHACTVSRLVHLAHALDATPACVLDAALATPGERFPARRFTPPGPDTLATADGV